MTEIKDKTPHTKNIKLRLELWREAKIEAVKRDIQLVEWVADAISEKLKRDKGGKE